jgi:hypothetical protein
MQFSVPFLCTVPSITNSENGDLRDETPRIHTVAITLVVNIHLSMDQQPFVGGP